jgi:hypothetical protein
MCWSAEVSLNTFLSGAFLTTIIYLLNPTDIFGIVFILSFLIIQLVEYFIWTNIDDKIRLRFFGFLTYFIIFLQPIMLMYFTKNYKYIYIYIALQLSTLILCLTLIDNIEFPFNIAVAKNGHLAWYWSNSYVYMLLFVITYLVFYLYLIYIYANPLIFIISIMTLLYSLYNYYKSYTIGSMWCWFANLIVSVYLIIAIYKFDKKHNKFIKYIYKK